MKKTVNHVPVSRRIHLTALARKYFKHYPEHAPFVELTLIDEEHDVVIALFSSDKKSFIPFWLRSVKISELKKYE